jgi:hypothetical protein
MKTCSAHNASTLPPHEASPPRPPRPSHIIRRLQAPPALILHRLLSAIPLEELYEFRSRDLIQHVLPAEPIRPLGSSLAHFREQRTHLVLAEVAEDLEVLGKELLPVDTDRDDGADVLEPGAGWGAET